MVDSVTGASAPITTTSAAGTASKSLAENFDTFLKLLTTQLQNQDPLQPMDSKEFTEQLVQFTNVEQSIATNKNLEQMIPLIQSAHNASVISYIGKDVTAEGQITTLGEHGATWSYELPSTADTTVLTVTDQNGKVVYQTAGATDKGKHEFTWDGTTTGGGEATPGLYQLSIASVDSLGNPITASTRVTGTVNAVETVDGLPVLVIGELRIRLGDVQFVGGPDNS